MSIARSDRLLAFVARARAKHKPPAEPPPGLFPAEDPVVVELLRSFLVWEAGAARAEAALRRIREQVVDLNELRVFLPDEIVSMLGPEDGRAQERAERLRASLNEVYAREHDMRLAHLAADGTRDIRGYFETLEGMHPFVAARVGLLCFGSQDFPLDTRLRDAIARSRAVPSDQPAPEISLLLAGLIPPGELASAYVAIEAHAEMQAPKRPSETRRRAPKAAPAVRKPAETRPKRSGRKPAKGAPTER